MMEFVFEQAPWELALDALNPGDQMEALKLLTLLEETDEDGALEALDALEQQALKLLHAKTGAEIARDVFGVDEEIYRAIWWHTTGHAGMTLLEKIIYLADYMEPTRDFPGVEELRKACYEDLDKGLLMGLEMSIEEMTAMGNPVHHATVEARDALKG